MRSSDWGRRRIPAARSIRDGHCQRFSLPLVPDRHSDRLPPIFHLPRPHLSALRSKNPAFVPFLLPQNASAPVFLLLQSRVPCAWCMPTGVVCDMRHACLPENMLIQLGLPGRNAEASSALWLPGESPGNNRRGAGEKWVRGGSKTRYSPGGETAARMPGRQKRGPSSLSGKVYFLQLNDIPRAARRVSGVRRIFKEATQRCSPCPPEECR